jgi:predicted peptidase
MKKAFKMIILCIVFFGVILFTINKIYIYLNDKSENNNFITKNPSKTEKTTTKIIPTHKKEDLYFEEFNSLKKIKILYHIYQDMEINEDTGFMIYFHGDNANDFNNGKNSKRINLLVNVAKKYNLLLIAIKTPSEDLTWWKDGENNAFYADEFINEFLLNEFDLNKDRVLLVGYSGGAEFLTENFIWRYLQKDYKGGTILFAGGSKPLNNIDFNDSFIKNFSFYYYSGTEDFMHDKVLEGANFFKEKGFSVKTDYPNGEDHFDIPFYSIVEEQLKNNFLISKNMP